MRRERGRREARLDALAIAGFAGFVLVGLASLAYLVVGDWKASALAGWFAVLCFVVFCAADAGARKAAR